MNLLLFGVHSALVTSNFEPGNTGRVVGRRGRTQTC